MSVLTNPLIIYRNFPSIRGSAVLFYFLFPCLYYIAFKVWVQVKIFAIWLVWVSFTPLRVFDPTPCYILIHRYAKIRQREGSGGGKTLVEFRGALGWINPASLTVCGRCYYAPEPVAFIRKHPLARCFALFPPTEPPST